MLYSRPMCVRAFACISVLMCQSSNSLISYVEGFTSSSLFVTALVFVRYIIREHVCFYLHMCLCVLLHLSSTVIQFL